MARNFFCTHCGQSVSVADGFLYNTILCPHCGSQMPVPQMPVRRVEPSEPVPTPFTIGELMQDAWNIGTKCWQPFLIMGIIVGGLNLAVWIGTYITSLASFLLLGPVIARPDDMNIGAIVAIVGILLTVTLLVSLVMVWLYSGEVAYSLAIVRGEQPPVSVLFSGMKNFWGILITGANVAVIFLCAWFVIIIVTGALPFCYLLIPEPDPVVFFVLAILFSIIGLVATFIVATWVGMMFCLSYFFVVDRQQKPVEAMKSSYRYVRTHFWKVLGSFLLIFVCTLAANSIPLVGIFLMTPVALCLYTVLYLKITGQKHGLSPETSITAQATDPPTLEFPKYVVEIESQ